MQNTAAIVFQGKPSGDDHSCSLAPQLGPSAASVDTPP